MKSPAGSKKRKTGATKDGATKDDQTKNGLMTAVARQVGRTAGTIVKAAHGLTGKDIPRSADRPTVAPSVKSQVSIEAATKESATEKAASSPARRRRKRSSAGARAKADTKTKKRSS